MNSALQRARATLAASERQPTPIAAELDEADRELLARYVEAFEHYDIEALTSLIQEDAIAVDAAVRPVARGPRRHPHLVVRARDRLQGLAGVPDGRSQRLAGFGQYKPSADGGYEPWALQVLELSDGGSSSSRSSSTPSALFPLFGLPAAARRVGRSASPTKVDQLDQRSRGALRSTTSRWQAGAPRAAGVRERRWCRGPGPHKAGGVADELGWGGDRHLQVDRFRQANSSVSNDEFRALRPV